MLAKSTSTLPTHPPSATPVADLDRSARTVERRHAAWVEIGEGLLQHCPDPDAFRINPDGRIASLQLQHAAHVAVWAAFLGLPAPEVHSQIPAADPTYRLTTTATTGVLDGVRWFLDHYRRDALDVLDPDTTPGTTSGVETVGSDGE